jgi:diguanylate cyclase (GGDEF)-like protein
VGRRSTVAFGAVIALLVVAAFAWTLLDSQSKAEHSIRSEFRHRAELTARLTADAVLSKNQTESQRAYFSGTANRMTEAVASYQAQAPAPRIIILDARGAVLAADPPLGITGARAAARRADIRSALAGRLAVSNLFAMHGRGAFVEVALPFRTKEGRRVSAVTVPTEMIAAFAGPFLAATAGVEGGRGYLVDQHNRLITTPALSNPVAGRNSAKKLKPGGRLPRRFSGEERAAVGVPGTHWRVVVSAPRSRLFAPVRGWARWSAWLVLGALVAAMIALLVLGALALRRSHELAHQRLYDPLTGLANRTLLLDAMERALARAARSGTNTAVLFLDLDGFKAINDSRGHAAGDELLRGVAERISAVVRPADLVARFAGDEFVIVCEDLSDESEGLVIAERLRDAMKADFELSTGEAHVGCSIGVAFASTVNAEPQRVLEAADAAMYEVKRQGGASVRLAVA